MTAVYLDTNAIIRLVETDDDLFEMLLQRARVDTLRLVTSEFTLAEILVLPLRDDDNELLSVYETLFSPDSEIEIAPVDRAVLRRTAELRARLGNRTPDAIHVATAVLAACPIFVSSDLRIRLPAGIRQIETEDVRELDTWE